MGAINHCVSLGAILIIACVFSSSALALLGSVTDHGSFHEVCVRNEGISYHFDITHTLDDSWPCGIAEISDSLH